MIDGREAQRQHISAWEKAARRWIGDRRRCGRLVFCLITSCNEFAFCFEGVEGRGKEVESVSLAWMLVA